MIHFSIVTPSYNQGRFIKRTIESVFSQETPAACLEYVVVDGGSSDETLDVLHGYEGRLRWMSEPDDGQADAVNKGIRATSGEIIGWLNSDDVYRPGAVVTVAAYLARHPEVDVVYGDATLIDAEDAVIGRYYTEPWNRKRLAYRPFLCQPAVFFRRRVIDRFGLLDTHIRYSMDYEYWLRLAYGGACFAYFPFTLASSRMYSETKTLSGGVRIHEELNAILKRYVNNVPDAWILTHTHALLRERSFTTPAEFALAVALVSWRLSQRANHSISPRLALSTLRTLTAGVAKTALGLPVVVPNK